MSSIQYIYNPELVDSVDAGGTPSQGTKPGAVVPSSARCYIARSEDVLYVMMLCR